MPQFKFSVVMAVYNVQPFLREAVESLLAQDIGFLANVQLILVDDGSTDESGKIAEYYAQCFPENILCLRRAHAGVSLARNAGLRHVEGEYVNFMDADDRLYPDALRKVYAFFAEHHEEVDLVSIPDQLFDAAHGEHVLNYKYRRGSRVIDLLAEYDMIQLFLHGAFIRRECTHLIAFDEHLIASEDAKECLKVLLEKCKLGVVADTGYGYRKRSSGQPSALHMRGHAREWYVPALQHFAYAILDYAKKRRGSVPRFVQYAILYNFQWCFRLSMDTIRRVLPEDEAEEFLRRFYGLLLHIEDCVILGQKALWKCWIEHKVFLLSKKYGQPPRLHAEDGGLSVKVCGKTVFALSRCKAVVECIRLSPDGLSLEGHASFLGIAEETRVQIFLRVNQAEDVPCVIKRAPRLGRMCLGEDIFPAFAFRGTVARLSRYAHVEITICTGVDGVRVERETLRVGEFFPVSTELREAYAVSVGWMLRMRGNRLLLDRVDAVGEARQEQRFLEELAGIDDPGAREAVYLRKAYRRWKPQCKHPVWLLSDRINQAGGHGEALFHWLLREKKPLHAYFALRKEDAGGQDRASCRRVLDYGSAKHRLCYLLADKVLSSMADARAVNPLHAVRKYYRDVFWKKHFVYLGYSITKDDLFDELQRYKQRVDIFLASGQREYAFIRDKLYFPDARGVALTGLPGHDVRVGQEGGCPTRARTIAIMPTWRKALASNKTYCTDGVKRQSPEKLRASAYAQFWQGLLRHPRLRACAEAKGYALRLVLHPSMRPYAYCFGEGETGIRPDAPTCIREVMEESCLVVTDYSSIALDFAYRQTPVVYCPFDQEEFYGRHAREKGFDAERDGFGEVCARLEDAVQQIILYVETGCVMGSAYRARLDRFFAFHDRENCARAYAAIQAWHDEMADGGKIGRTGKKHAMRVGFLMQAPAMWSNLRPVYERMRERPEVEVYGFVVPGYEGEGIGRCRGYDPAHEYFHRRYGQEVVDALDVQGKAIDLARYRLDYMFYQRPYEAHLPEKLRCAEVSKITRTCYIPYGYTGLMAFERYAIAQREFFHALHVCFADSARANRLFRQAYRGCGQRGEEKFVFLGYPALEHCLRMPQERPAGDQKALLWMPRWRAEESHFLAYKENFLRFRQRHKTLGLILRPHPLMLDELQRRGLFTPMEAAAYRARMEEAHARMDGHTLVEESFPDADILLADFSSSVILFFMTGKPVIYCSPAEEMNPDYRRIAEGMYMARDGKDVGRYLRMLLRGEDSLREKRLEIIQSFREEHLGATDRIIDAMLEDHRAGERAKP